MWKFTNSALPVEAIAPSPAPLARIAQDDYYSVAPLARINLNAPQQLPGIEKAAIPTTAVLTLPAPVDGAYVVDASVTNLNGVAAVEFNGSGYTPASDLLNPQPGEFIFDPYQNSIAIYPKESDRLEEGLSVQVVGTAEGVSSDRLQPPFPEIFYKVPLTGELTWSRGLEQHPSGNLTLDATDRNIDAIREAFKNGTELSFYGIGFRVGGYSEERAPIDEYPAGEWKVSISLGGMWENYTDKSVNLREQTPQVGSAIAYSDPACGPGESGNSSTTTTSNQITFAQLAARAGAAYDGPELKIKIAGDTPKDATTTLDQELQPRLRINNAFAFYSGTQAIAARNFYNTRLWNFGEYLGGFSRTYQAIADPQQYSGQDLNLPQPDPTLPLPDTVQLPPVKTLQPEPTNLVGYAAKYPCVRLEGKFAEPKSVTGEDTQGNKINQPGGKLLILKSGHSNPEQPPAGSKRIKNCSLNFDQSGPPLYEETFTYGFAYLGRDIANDDDELDGIPATWWKLVRYEKTVYLYDEKTRYLLGTNTTGWTLARFKTESGETPETIDIDPEEGDRLALYQFRPIPILSRTRYLLKPYRDYYKDVQDKESSASTEKKCDRAGSSTVRIVDDINGDSDPEPCFIFAEATETIAYARTPNPDSDPEAPLPDLETGEESYSYKFVKILPSKNTISTEGIGLRRSRNEDQPDKYIQFTPQDFGQDPGFASVSQEFTFEEFEGRPAAATRKNKAPDEDSETTGNREDDGKLYKYVLTTPGYDPATSPEQGNISYEYAETLEQAQDAAKLDLKLRDCKESFQEKKTVPFNPWMAEGDRYRDITSGYLCDRRILGVGCKVAFNGRLVNGSLDITAGETDLTLGIDRAIEKDVTVHKLPIPDPSRPPVDFNVIDNTGFSLGELLPKTTPNRRNPFGEQTDDE
jgi:hypothetical protein